MKTAEQILEEVNRCIEIGQKIIAAHAKNPILEAQARQRVLELLMLRNFITEESEDEQAR